MNKYLDIFKSIWEAPAGKQVVAILMIVPIAMGFFYNFYYNDLLTNKDLEIKELKNQVKVVATDERKALNLYVSATEQCSSQLRRVDSIHIAKFNDYRDKVEKKYAEDNLRLEKDYKEAITTLTKTRIINEKTKKELTSP